MSENGPYALGGFKGKGKKHKGDHRGGKKCCFAGQAVKAVWLGKFRLAARFARLDAKTRLGLI
jgi:hypothetical protein